jgi:hypothetical protein
MRSIIASLAVAAALSFAGGAQATTYIASLSGLNEAPPNASPGMGSAELDINADLMRVRITFSGLLGTSTASHIHCCTATPGAGTAGVATVTPTFTNFPLGVTSGSYDQTFDLLSLASYNPAFVTASGGTVAGAEAALLAGLAAGEAYLNVHSTVVPGGEIRGFLTAVPEPGTWALALLGFGLLGADLRRRRAAVAAA